MRKTYAVLILASLLGGCSSDDDDTCTTDAQSTDGASASGAKPKPGQFGSGAAMPCADENDDEDSKAGSGGKGGSDDRGDAVGSIGSIGGKAGAGGKGGSSGSKGGAGGSSGGTAGTGTGGSSTGTGGSGSSQAGADFTEVASMLDAAQCSCLGFEDVAECTGVTAAQQQCQADAAESAGAAASSWLNCAADLLAEALDCLQAAECSAAKIQACPVVGAEMPGAELAAECGAPPAALSDAIGACTAAPSNPGSGSDACGNTLYICDGEEDCADGSDEKNCFMCEDGSPIPSEWVCDDEADCSEGEDESPGNCGGPGAPPASPKPDPEPSVPPPPAVPGPSPSP